MRDARAPGPTFDIANIGFIDFETYGAVSITHGSDSYTHHAQAIVLAWAIGNGPVKVDAVTSFGEPLQWGYLTYEFLKFFERVERGDALLCAHNASFDRAVWNNSTRWFPRLEPHMIIDSRVQAAASGLPPALDYAAKYVGSGVLKDKAGKALIKLFTLPKSEATPQSHPAEWQAFLRYASDDVAAMRGLFKATRQLPLAEWQEYWASEAINDRGVSIDLDLVEAAARMAVADHRLSSHELYNLTSGDVTTVNQVKRMNEWLMSLLPSDGRDILVKTLADIDEDGTVVQAEETSLERKRVERLLAWLKTQTPLSDRLRGVERLLQIRLYGGSKTPAKFGRMLMQNVGGVIRDQYVFNGASQTGRFSARGIQIHNLMRDAAPNEIEAIDALCSGMNAHDFARLGDDTPISRKLSMLIRPSLVAQPGNAFVWGDWANIEARITPWLANDRVADRRLDIFRAVDEGREKYDIYVRTAAEISGLTLEEAKDKKIRQRGKVVELACGFGGGVNALHSMAAGYGMHLTDAEAQDAVDRWRDANPWGPKFWRALMTAVNDAMATPQSIQEVGRVKYVFLPSYLGGSLMCQLPSGRCLTYRRLRWDRVDEIDPKTDEIIGIKRELKFSRDMGRVKLWPGLLCENIVQATAADILRGTLLRLESDARLRMKVVLHTHDEIVTEVEAQRAEAGEIFLKRVMEQGFDWSTRLPIAADTTIARWYSKSEQSWGL
jgi:DNA polymerase